MSAGVRRKDRPRQSRRYGIGGVSMVLTIAVVAVGIITVGSCRAESDPPSGRDSFLPEVTRVGAAEVKAQLDEGANIIIVDTRSKAEYARSHIVGAVPISLEEISLHYEGNPLIMVDELRHYDEVITYCT